MLPASLRGAPPKAFIHSANVNTARCMIQTSILARWHLAGTVALGGRGGRGGQLPRQPCMHGGRRAGPGTYRLAMAARAATAQPAGDRCKRKEKKRKEKEKEKKRKKKQVKQTDDDRTIKSALLLLLLLFFLLLLLLPSFFFLLLLPASFYLFSQFNSFVNRITRPIIIGRMGERT